MMLYKTASVGSKPEYTSPKGVRGALCRGVLHDHKSQQPANTVTHMIEPLALKETHNHFFWYGIETRLRCEAELYIWNKHLHRLELFGHDLIFGDRTGGPGLGGVLYKVNLDTPVHREL